MCNSGMKWVIIPPKGYFSRLKRLKVRVHRLKRKQRSYQEKILDKIMELKNLKLYMENLSILQENENLRKKASLLHQENIALMSQFRKKFTNFKSCPTTFLVKDAMIE